MSLLNGTIDKQPVTTAKNLPRSSVPEEVLRHPEIVYFVSYSINYTCRNILLKTSPISTHALGS